LFRGFAQAQGVQPCAVGSTPTPAPSHTGPRPVSRRPLGAEAFPLASHCQQRGESVIRCGYRVQTKCDPVRLERQRDRVTEHPARLAALFRCAKRSGQMAGGASGGPLEVRRAVAQSQRGPSGRRWLRLHLYARTDPRRKGCGLTTGALRAWRLTSRRSPTDLPRRWSLQKR
jgi:hypothetical protein